MVDLDPNSLNLDQTRNPCIVFGSSMNLKNNDGFSFGSDCKIRCIVNCSNWVNELQNNSFLNYTSLSLSVLQQEIDPLLLLMKGELL